MISVKRCKGAGTASHQLTSKECGSALNDLFDKGCLAKNVHYVCTLEMELTARDKIYFYRTQVSLGSGLWVPVSLSMTDL